MAMPNEALTPGRKAWVYPDRRVSMLQVPMVRISLTEGKDAGIVNLSLDKCGLIKVAVVNA